MTDFAPVDGPEIAKALRQRAAEKGAGVVDRGVHTDGLVAARGRNAALPNHGATCLPDD